MSDEEKIQTAALGILGLLGLDQLRKNQRRKGGRDDDKPDDDDDINGGERKISDDDDTSPYIQMGQALLMSDDTLQDAANDLQKVRDLDVPEGSGNEIIELKKDVDAEWDYIQDRVRFLEEERNLVQAAIDRKDYSDKVLPYIRSIVIQIRDRLFNLNKKYDKLVAAVDRYLSLIHISEPTRPY